VLKFNCNPSLLLIGLCVVIDREGIKPSPTKESRDDERRGGVYPRPVLNAFGINP
jgi:hypothetical protein